MECPVCLESSWLVTFPCQHNICIRCLFNLVKDECPLCRKPFVKTLPDEIKQYLKCNVKKTYNIHDNEDFPSLR